MNYNELRKTLEKGRLSPLYLLVVEDADLERKAVDCFIQALVPPGERSFNLDIVDAGETGMERLEDAMGALPFLGRLRLVIVKNFHNFKYGKKASALSRYLEKPDPSIVTVFTTAAKREKGGFTAALDRRNALNKLLLKHAKAVELKKLTRPETAAWIAGEADALGISIDGEAIEYLMERTGKNLGILQNELEKARAYTGGRRRITVRDVEVLACDAHTDTLFELTDAVGEKDLDKALAILKNILSHGTSHLALLGMLARQFRLIWRAQSLVKAGTPSAGILKGLGVPFFVMKKLVSQSRKFTEGELALCFERMSQLDRRWKQTDIPPALLLENLLLDFCAARRS